MAVVKKDKIGFAVNCIVMAALLFVFCFCIVMPQYEGNYQAAMLDKVKKLKDTEGPRVILIGNSNLAFGMDSEFLEKQINRPVINMGLHGGTGNCFNERAALLDVHEGDVYVICHTNYDDNDEIKNPLLAWITLENHYELYGLVRGKDWPCMIKAYPTYLRKCLEMWRTETGNEETDDAYRRSAFNERGDDYYPRPETLGDIDYSTAVVHHINEETAGRLNELYKTLKGKGADMVIAAYPIPMHENAASPQEYADFTAELSEALDAPVISDFQEYMYDTSYFYDTYAHLTDTGVYVRTSQLAADLNKYFGGAQ